jgi:heme exporter protein D
MAFAWIESSAYAADAVARRMPLIGNLPKSAHDFYNLFSMKGLLEDHMFFAWFMYWIGIMSLILFLSYPLWERKQYDSVEISMDL